MTPIRSSQTRRWAALAILGGVGFLGFLIFQLLGLLIEPVKQDLGVTDTQLGLLNGFGIAIFFACAAFPIGWLADRYDRRLILAACLLVWSAATVACGLAQSFTGYAAGVVAIAIGESAMIPIVYAIIPRIFTSDERAAANAIVYAILAAAGGLGLLLGGAALGWIEALRGPDTLLGTTAAWRLLFVLTGLVGLPMALLLVVVPRSAASGADAVTSARPSFGGFLRANLVTIFGVYLATSLYSVGWGTLYFWTPAMLGRALGYSPARAGTDAGLVVLAATAIGIALAWWLMRTRLPRLGPGGALTLARWGCWIALPGMIGLAFAPNVAMFMAMLGLVAIGLFFSTALAPTILQDIAPNVFSSRIIALYPLALMLPRAVVPSLAGALSDWGGASATSLVYSVCLVSGLTLPLGIVLLRWIEPAFARLATRNRLLDSAATP